VGVFLWARYFSTWEREKLGGYPAGHTLLSVAEDGRYTATWKREFTLPWRKAGLLISMIKWTRTSRLSIKISLSLWIPARAQTLECCRARSSRHARVLEGVGPFSSVLQGYLTYKKTQPLRTLPQASA